MMLKSKIAIIGNGYVGKAFVDLFKPHYDIEIYDPAYPEHKDKSKVSECSLAIVCVPTPMKENRECDISIIESCIEWLDTPLILIKSAIPPGTTDYLKNKYKKHIVVSPEYLGEGKYFTPFWKYPHPTKIKYHNFVIIGGESKDCNEVMEYFKEVLGADVRYVKTNSRTAELTKYMENSWIATKVIFCNEFYEIAQTFGVDYDELRELFLLDGRVERMHTVVFKNRRGFSGKCLPKDINAIMKASEKVGYKPLLLRQVVLSNIEFNNKNRRPND